MELLSRWTGKRPRICKHGSGVCRAIIAGVLVGAPLLATAGTWQTLKNPPPLGEIIDPSGNDFGPGGAGGPLLMTDGSVLIQDAGVFGEDGTVLKLTPDIHGSYVNGTWSRLASKPFISFAGAQAVLADGRVILEGGELSDFGYIPMLTNQGAIYDPVSNTWTPVPPPLFFNNLFPGAAFAPHPIGDSASVILADGTFMLADKFSHQAALLDLKTLTWTETGTATKSDLNDEEGWTLLPDGKVLTVDCYADFLLGLIPGHPADPTNSEIYDPATGEWSSAGSTVHTLTDPVLAEVGPAVLRPDGTVFALGSSGDSSIYETRSHRWVVGPTLPVSPQGFQYTAQDAPGALLPDGNVLLAVTGGHVGVAGFSNPPVAFFEFDGRKFIAEPTIPNAANDFAFSISLLLLPTGQVLAVDSTKDIEIYTPDEKVRGDNRDDEDSHRPEWAPRIFRAPLAVRPGGSYRLTGIRLNGVSQGSVFGDELPDSTNYPLVRITNLKTHHVFYSRTHDHSSMSVSHEQESSTHFDVPATQESGLSRLEVVANAVASEPVLVFVEK